MTNPSHFTDEYEHEHHGLEDMLPEGARETLRGVDQRVRGFVSEYPLAAVAGALAAGFFIGRMLR